MPDTTALLKFCHKLPLAHSIWLFYEHAPVGPISVCAGRQAPSVLAHRHLLHTSNPHPTAHRLPSSQYPLCSLITWKNFPLSLLLALLLLHTQETVLACLWNKLFPFSPGSDYFRFFTTPFTQHVLWPPAITKTWPYTLMWDIHTLSKIQLDFIDLLFEEALLSTPTGWRLQGEYQRACTRVIRKLQN